MKEFGQILKELRLSKNLSQESLGKVLNVSRSSIARYENSLGLPPTDIIENICNYFNVEKDYLFPKENVEEILVTKNKKIKFQKILLICSLCLILFGIFIGIMNFIPSIVSSGKMDILTAEKLQKEPEDNIKFFKYNDYEFGYINVVRNDENEFILKPGGEIWSLDGMPDYLMGYYNGENTNLYFYASALNKVEVKYVSISSEGKYCYDTPEYKFGYNFVICNNTQEDINIGYIEFWC